MRAKLSLITRLGELMLRLNNLHVTPEANNNRFNLLVSIRYGIADEFSTICS